MSTWKSPFQHRKYLSQRAHLTFHTSLTHTWVYTYTHHSIRTCVHIYRTNTQSTDLVQYQWPMYFSPSFSACIHILPLLERVYEYWILMGYPWGEQTISSKLLKPVSLLLSPAVITLWFSCDSFVVMMVVGALHGHVEGLYTVRWDMRD